MKINAPAVERVWKFARMKFLRLIVPMLSFKIVMRVWNAGHAAVTVRLTQFQWSQVSAARQLLSTRCWGERAVNVRAASNPPNQLQRKAVAVVDTWFEKNNVPLITNVKA
jgi:hypothetical protein